MVEMQASIVPYDIFSLIVVFIIFVKCDEVSAKVNQNHILDNLINETESCLRA